MQFASSANPQFLIAQNQNNQFAASVAPVGPVQVISQANQMGSSQLSHPNLVYPQSYAGPVAGNWTNFSKGNNEATSQRAAPSPMQFVS